MSIWKVNKQRSDQNNKGTRTLTTVMSAVRLKTDQTVKYLEPDPEKFYAKTWVFACGKYSSTEQISGRVCLTVT